MSAGRFKRCVLGGVFWCCLGLNGAPLAVAAEIPAAVKDMVRARVDGDKTAGMVVGLADARGMTFFGYGRLPTAQSDIAVENVIFEIGSISKVFTGVLLAAAVDRGEVRLTDPIAAHLPADLPLSENIGSTIRLVNLSAHNSGLPRMPDNISPQDPGNPYADYGVEELYTFLGEVSLSRQVADAYEYSNLGAGLLGHLLARASNQTYEALVVQRIAGELGMPDTRITLNPERQDRLARGHAGAREVPNWDLGVLAGAGGLRSTARDMLVFLSANAGLMDTELAATLRMTHRVQGDAGSPQMDMGMGWHILKVPEGDNVFWHNGGTGGYRAFAGFTQNPPQGVVVLTNSGGAGDDDIGFHLLNPELPMAPFAPRREIELPMATLDQYVGRYQLSDQRAFKVTRQESQLMVQLSGQPTVPVFPETATRFFYKVVDAQLEFELNTQGAVTALVLYQGGGVFKAKRIAP